MSARFRTSPRAQLTAVVVALLTALVCAAADPKPTSPVSVPTPTTAAAATPPGVPFETFRPIADRNIFDPNRVGRSTRSTRIDPARPTGDSIALVGTLRYEKGYFAFFDSPDSKFKKVVHEGEPIAEFSVTHISASSVDLIRNGKTISLQVAQRLRRPVGEDWTIAAVETPRTDPT